MNNMAVKRFYMPRLLNNNKNIDVCIITDEYNYHVYYKISGAKKKTNKKTREIHFFQNIIQV